jgi:hypothetical protein
MASTPSLNASKRPLLINILRGLLVYFYKYILQTHLRAGFFLAQRLDKFPLRAA